jgi:fucose permease
MRHLWPTLGEEKTFVDDDDGGALVIGGVGGALIGVPFAPHVCLTTLLLVVSLLLLLPFLVFVLVTFTRIWSFSDKVTDLRHR